MKAESIREIQEVFAGKVTIEGEKVFAIRTHEGSEVQNILIGLIRVVAIDNKSEFYWRPENPLKSGTIKALQDLGYLVELIGFKYKISW